MTDMIVPETIDDLERELIAAEGRLTPEVALKALADVQRFMVEVASSIQQPIEMGLVARDDYVSNAMMAMVVEVQATIAHHLGIDISKAIPAGTFAPPADYKPKPGPNAELFSVLGGL